MKKYCKVIAKSFFADKTIFRIRLGFDKIGLLIVLTARFSPIFFLFHDFSLKQNLKVTLSHRYFLLNQQDAYFSNAAYKSRSVGIVVFVEAD